MLQTRKSNPNRPTRIMIYGQEGAGKSTFGAYSDSPVFISTEGGTDQITNQKGEPIDEMQNVKTWDGLMDAVKALRTEQHLFKTLVLDSADWIEKLAHKDILSEENDKDIIRANGGYGAGLSQSENMHRELIEELEKLRNEKNMNVIVTAHTHVKTFKDPTAPKDYDVFEIKCHEKVSSIWREWVDILMFVRFDSHLKDDGKKTTKIVKALGDGGRTAYFVKEPAFQAKNRYGIPAKLPFTFQTWDTIRPYINKAPIDQTAEQVYADCLELLPKVPDVETRNKATENVEKNKTNVTKLVSFRKKLRELTVGA